MTLISSRSDNDIVDYMRMLERRLARLERGTQGNSGGDDPTVITSLAISGLTLSTQTVIAADDYYRVMMRYSWTAVPDDPSEYNKDALDGYLTSWSINGTNYTADTFTTNTFIDVGPFTQGQSVTFRVRARTVKGTIGAYTQRTDSTTTDSTAPFQPSTPVVTPYLGQLAIDWNGLDVSAGQPPTDFRFVEVHISTTGATFTPTVSTLVGTILRGGGTWIATDLTYGTTYYSRLVAVDTVGNRSPSSTAGSGIPEQLVNGDMGPNSIATANIQNLAVNNAKISDLSVGKLTVGTLTANMTVGARIMTAATGARVEMNVNGIQAFNSGGGQTVDIAAATGDVTITGAFKTGLTGARLEMTDTVDRTTIELFGTYGGDPAFMNSPTDGSGSPRIGINTGSFTYAGISSKHRLFLNNASGIRLESYQTGSSATYGYSLALTEGTANLDRNPGGGGGFHGASLQLATNTFELIRFGTTAIIDGGRISSDTNNLFVAAYDVGTLGGQLTLGDDGSLEFTGAFTRSFTASGKSALFTDVWSGVNLSAGGTVNYGVTMGTIPVPFYSIESGSDQGNDRMPVAKSATSFTVQHIASVSISLHYWCVRLF